MEVCQRLAEAKLNRVVQVHLEMVSFVSLIRSIFIADVELSLYASIVFVLGCRYTYCWVQMFFGPLQMP